MTNPINTLLRLMPTAAPTDADVATWRTLTRDEQLSLLKAKLGDTACSEVTSVTMRDVLHRARDATERQRG